MRQAAKPTDRRRQTAQPPADEPARFLRNLTSPPDVDLASTHSPAIAAVLARYGELPNPAAAKRTLLLALKAALKRRRAFILRRFTQAEDSWRIRQSRSGHRPDPEPADRDAPHDPRRLPQRPRSLGRRARSTRVSQRPPPGCRLHPRPIDFTRARLVAEPRRLRKFPARAFHGKSSTLRSQVRHHVQASVSSVSLKLLSLWLLACGIEPNSIHDYYVARSWLERLVRGVYRRPTPHARRAAAASSGPSSSRPCNGS